MLSAAWSSLVDWRSGSAWLMQRATAELSAATGLRLLSESRVTLSVCALVALAYARRQAVAILCASVAIFFVSCAAIEIGFKELPARLFAPLQVALVIAMLITCRMRSRPRASVLTMIGATLAGALFLQQAWTTVASAVADRRQSQEIDAQVLELMKQRPSLLVLHADSFPSEFWWRPFHTPPVQLPAIQLGLNNNQPDVRQFIDETYGGSLLQAMCSDPSIIVVAERGRLDPVTTFMREHYGTDVTWIPAFDGSFRAWRCSPTAASNGSTRSPRTTY
jgi:hypothetical protein